MTVTSFAVYILGGTYLFYGIIQPPKALLLAVSGTLAVALGLSLKDLIASVVAGVILPFDSHFRWETVLLSMALMGKLRVLD